MFEFDKEFIGFILRQSISFLDFDKFYELGLDKSFMLACLHTYYINKKRNDEIVYIDGNAMCHFDACEFYLLHPLWSEYNGRRIIEELHNLAILILCNPQSQRFLFCFNPILELEATNEYVIEE
jgi:hypothetical protein